MTKRQRLLWYASEAISGIGLGLAMPGLLIMGFADWLDRRLLPRSDLALRGRSGGVSGPGAGNAGDDWSDALLRGDKDHL